MWTFFSLNVQLKGMWQVREATFGHTLKTHFHPSGRDKAGKNIPYITIPCLQYSLPTSVFQFCYEVQLIDYFMVEMASQCLDRERENTSKMYISPKWVSWLYSFYNTHDNKKPNTKLFIEKKEQNVFRKSDKDMRWISVNWIYFFVSFENSY